MIDNLKSADEIYLVVQFGAKDFNNRTQELIDENYIPFSDVAVQSFHDEFCFSQQFIKNPKYIEETKRKI